MSKQRTLYNGKTAHHDLYFGGGCFPDFNLCPEYEDKEAWMAAKAAYDAKNSGLGSNRTGSLISYDQQCKGSLWPAPPVEEGDKYPAAIAAHRDAGIFALSRHFCFVQPSEKGLRKPYQNQSALMAYYHEQAACGNLEVPFSLGAIIIPPKAILHGIYVENYSKSPGIEFDVVERFTGEEYFGGLVGDDPEFCDYLPAPAGQEMTKEMRVVDICVNAMPPLNEDACKPDEPSLLDGWCVMVSALLCCPDTGNG